MPPEKVILAGKGLGPFFGQIVLSEKVILDQKCRQHAGSNTNDLFKEQEWNGGEREPGNGAAGHTIDGRET